MKNTTLVTARLIDAPPSRVFSAWRKPEHLVHSWGPRNFTLPTCGMDFRFGGTYRFCMRAPDGSDHWVRGAYREIVAPTRLVFIWERDDEPGLRFQSHMVVAVTVVAVTFTDRAGRTEFTLHQSEFQTPSDREDHLGGWNQCLDRLAA
jgi:uncharacterized protein YndB with AHSA1/START domain